MSVCVRERERETGNKRSHAVVVVGTRVLYSYFTAEPCVPIVAGVTGYSHLSDTESPIIPTNSKAPEIPTVFWLGSYLSDSKKGP